MDPDATLLEMLEISHADQSQYHDDIHRLCELMLDLHRWLESGGHMPMAWANARLRYASDAVWAGSLAPETGGE